MEKPPPDLPNALARSGLEKPRCACVKPSEKLSLVPDRLIPLIPPPGPNGVPGTDLLGMAGRLAILSAIPVGDVLPLGKMPS